MGQTNSIRDITRFEQLIDAVKRHDCDKFKALIDAHSNLISIRDIQGRNVVFYILEERFYHEREYVGRYMLGTVKDKITKSNKSTDKRIRVMKDVFESTDKCGSSPVFLAASNVYVLNFFVHYCCPSGVNILETKDIRDIPLAHYTALHYRNIEALYYIIQNAPSGTELLHEKYQGYSLMDCAKIYAEKRPNPTPFEEKCLWECKFVKFFRSAELSSCYFREEIRNAANAQSYTNDENSLISLMLGVIIQHSELLYMRK